MSHVDLLLRQLHDAQTDLAEEFREVAHRQAAEHDIYYLGQTLASQCDTQAQKVREMAAKFDTALSADDDGHVANVMSALRRKTSEMLGRQPPAALLMLRDLRRLYLMAEEVNLLWITMGQLAQAVRDEELLSEVSMLHKQTLTQIKWLKTRVKEAAPQALLV